MRNIIEYLKSVKFALEYNLRFAFYQTFIMLVLYIIDGGIPYLSAYYLGKLVNIITVSASTRTTDGLWLALCLYTFSSALPSIFTNFQQYVNRRRMLPLQMEADLDLLKKREQIDIARYEDPAFQDLVQRTFRGGPNPIFQLSSAQFNLIYHFASLVTGTFLAIKFSPLIYIVVITTAIPGFLADVKYASHSWSIWAKDSPNQRKLANLRRYIMDRIPLIETKLLQSSNKILGEIRKIFSDFAKIQVRLENNKMRNILVVDIISYAGFAYGLYLVVNTVISGEQQVGALVFMLGTLTRVRGSISGVLAIISGQYENHLVIKDMIKFINTPPEIVEPLNPTDLSLKTAPEIVFENVGFKYPNSEKWSLKNLNFTFKAGDNIGLVGNNGAGKTTLVKLLCRIYDPTEGRILINGVDLKDVATKEWWSYLAVMFQDYASYDFTVEEAIAIGKPDKPSNLTKVIEAAKVSQAHDFIMDWEGKYNQQLGVEFGGKEPSKGQRQKLSIAKILYRNSPVMVLDEPTASVDAESEAKIFDSIENLPKDRTAILISHDFSTISQCDKIYVLDKGKLVEEGTHKELMKNKSMYSELYKLQADRFRK